MHSEKYGLHLMGLRKISIIFAEKMIRISIRFSLQIHISRVRNPREVQQSTTTHAASAKPQVESAQFADRATEQSPGVQELCLATVQNLGEAVSRSTRENYLTALRSLLCFADGDLPVSSIDAILLQRYERWLRERGLCLNTVSCYMRSLRSVLNKARPADNRLDDAFRGVYKGRAATEKRAISQPVISKLKSLNLDTKPQLALARDIFLFCFYAQGMPFVDVAFLRRSQVTDGRIVYHRHKTGGCVTVALQPCMEEIMARHKGTYSDYLFPLLNTTDPQQAYDEYLKRLNSYNRSLKKVARMARITENLTSYVARHSWATAAYHQNVELPVISKALGHSNPQTTLTYIREIDDRRLEEANSRIIANLS